MLDHAQTSLDGWVVATPRRSPVRFTLFSELPTEIRFLIWNWTLVPRAVEIVFCSKTGIRTKVANPVALSVCQDSRNAVIHAYPLCFGWPWFRPFTRFNFRLDALYISRSFGEWIPLFFGTLISDEDIRQLRYFALDAIILDHTTLVIDTTSNDQEPQELEVCILREAINRMTGLEEFVEVYLLHHWAQHIDWLLLGGNGRQIKLCDKIPSQFEEPELDIVPKLPLAEDCQYFWQVTPKTQSVFGVVDGLATAPGAPHRERLRYFDCDYFGWADSSGYY